MAHRYTARDVDRALARYRELTGDTDAAYTVEEKPNPRNGVPTQVYRVTGSARLRGFEGYGAYSAWHALESYCNGFEDGLRAKAKPP